MQKVKNRSGCGCCGAAPGPVIGNVSFHVAGACHRGAAHPHLSVFTVQEGSPSPVNTVQSITFGTGVTGGTFRINGALAQPTANITWSSDPATLASRIQSALIALVAYGPSDVVVTPLANSYLVEFTGTKAGLNISTMTVDNNSLTGSPATIAIQSAQVGSASLNEFQALVVGLEPGGGTFKLTYDGQTTASITWAMSGGSPNYTTIAANIDAALESLSNIPAGGVSVGTDLVVQFTGGLAGTNLPTMTVAENLLTTPTTANRPSIPGAEVTLYKGGVEVSSGTTDSDGNIRLPIYEPGTDYTVGVVASGFFPGVNAVPAYGAQAAGTLGFGRNGGVRFELERPAEIPIYWYYEYGPPDPEPPIWGTPVEGAAISLVGVAGTQGEGFSAAGSTDASGGWLVWVPGWDAYDPADHEIDYAVDFPLSPSNPDLTGTLDFRFGTLGCGGVAGRPMTATEWPEGSDPVPSPP
jgi:hypothetical protein